MKAHVWHGCYDKSLKGFITDQSFGHPAKYSLGLIERIFDHCLERGYLKRGGWEVVTSEIQETIRKELCTQDNSSPESEMVSQQSSNQASHQQRSFQSGASQSGRTDSMENEPGSKSASPMNGCVGQSGIGYSTQDQSLTASSSTISTKTNWTTELKISHSSSGPATLPATGSSIKKRVRGNTIASKLSSAHSALDILKGKNKMGIVSAQIAEPSTTGRQTVVTRSGYEVAGVPEIGTKVYCHASVIGDPFGGVGIGGLVAAYRGLRWYGLELEPRFVGWSGENIARHKSKLEYLGCPVPMIAQGDSRKFHESVEASAIVSSPPYADSIDRASGIDPSKVKKPGGPNGNTHHDIYGEASGQIGRLSADAVDGVISSPPFTQGYQGGGGINKNGYSGKHLTGKHRCGNPDEVGKRTYQGRGGQREPGNIETLKEGSVEAVVSSRPYAIISTGAGGLNIKPAKHDGQQSGRSASAASQDTDQKYGTTDGQIARLKGGDVDAVVTSPPYEDRVQAHDPKYRPAGNGHGPRHSEYGDSPGQIGKEKGPTYWSEMKIVYESCFKAIRPGGVIVLVVKDYIKAGRRVRLCDDTLRLLEHIGFQPLERVHAMLVSETVENGLFGEERTKRQRKSFFRRLYEAKIPEGDERRIDHEEVLICRRP